MDIDADIDDEQVWDIDRKKAFDAPERISLVTKYILDHFDQKTYRGNPSHSYSYMKLMNISDVASADNGKVKEIKDKQRVSGFNSIFAVSSVDTAKLYYEEFQKQMKADITKKLKIAVIYSYGANEEEADGILDEENPEDTSALDQTARDFLDKAIMDYNMEFHTNYDTSSDKFQNYYKDVSLRMKNKELDLLIVVKQRESDLKFLIETFKLKEDATHKFIENALREGELKTVGADISSLMAPVSRFGGGRADKKKDVIEALKAFFSKYYGVQ